MVPVLGYQLVLFLVKPSLFALSKQSDQAVEVGIGEAASVAELFTAASNMEKTAEIIKDLAGIERVVIAWKQQ